MLTDGYIIEVALPWSVIDHTATGYVPSVGDTHGVNFFLVDYGNVAHTGLAAFWDPTWNPALLPTLTLVETSTQHSAWAWNTGSTAYRLLKADLNEPKDNAVTLSDFAIMASEWLK